MARHGRLVQQDRTRRTRKCMPSRSRARMCVVSTATRHVLQVFLASPGDLADERLTARIVVDAINHGVARELGWQVDLVGWEETLPGYSRPQERINAEVDACDLFVGLLYERWGTPTGEFSSGFEEEFERARSRREASGQVPEIWLFFKAMEPKLARDPGDDAKRVLAFRAKTVAEKKLLYREFRTTTDWERVFWSDLSTELTRRALQERAVDEPQGSSAESESGAGEAATASGEAAYPEVERGGEA